MKIILATSLWMRLTGLLVSSRCTQGEVLLLAPCKSIHTYGMREPLDVAFIDANAQVLASEQNLPPGTTRSHHAAVAVLERRSSAEGAWFKRGDVLGIELFAYGSHTEELGEGIQATKEISIQTGERNIA